MNVGKACRTYWFYVSIWPLWMLVLPSSFSAWNNPLKRLAKANREQNNKNALTLFPERGRCELLYQARLSAAPILKLDAGYSGEILLIGGDDDPACRYCAGGDSAVLCP